MSHTPLPWKVIDSRGMLFIAAEPYEGHPCFQRTTTIEVMSDEEYPTREGDAALIVRAVNNHQKLVDALKAAVPLIDREFLTLTSKYAGTRFENDPAYKDAVALARDTSALLAELDAK